jgi:hypothetical protein
LRLVAGLAADFHATEKAFGLKRVAISQIRAYALLPCFIAWRYRKTAAHVRGML